MIVLGEGEDEEEGGVVEEDGANEWSVGNCLNI